MDIDVFVDSDVVISSLISNSGAAHLLINQPNKITPKINLKLVISNLSIQELEIVVGRLNLDKNELKNLIKRKFNILNLKETNEQLKKNFREYAIDPDDSHIVAAAKESKVKFLVSYNLRDFKIEKIKQDFNIIVTNPANLLQYLRSL